MELVTEFSDLKIISILLKTVTFFGFNIEPAESEGVERENLNFLYGHSLCYITDINLISDEITEYFMK